MTYVIVGSGEMMARPKSSQDTTMLEMALVGYEFQKQKIDEKIREIRASLGGLRPASKAAPEAATERAVKSAAPKKRRTLSAEARKRIAAAQKRRWAEHRKNQAGQDKA